jgi:hypothetical protein
MIFGALLCHRIKWLKSITSRAYDWEKRKWEATSILCFFNDRTKVASLFYSSHDVSNERRSKSPQKPKRRSQSYEIKIGARVSGVFLAASGLSPGADSWRRLTHRLYAKSAASSWILHSPCADSRFEYQFNPFYTTRTVLFSKPANLELNPKR